MVSDRDSRGYWRIDPALVITALICVVAIFYVGWDYIALETAQRIAERYDREADAQPSDEEVTALCAARPEPDRVQCAIDKMKSREKWDEDRRDLNAQEGMEFWAKWMFLAALAGTIVAGYGLVLLRRTWAETKRTADITREIGEAQVKAYLGVTAVSMQRDGESQFASIRICIKNAGNSPALDTTVVIRMRVTRASPPYATESNFCVGMSDAAQADTVSGDIRHIGGKIAESNFGRDWSHLEQVYIRVIVFAKDVFNKEVTAFGHFSKRWGADFTGSKVALQELDPVQPFLGRAFIDDQINEARRYVIELYRPQAKRQRNVNEQAR